MIFRLCVFWYDINGFQFEKLLNNAYFTIFNDLNFG